MDAEEASTERLRALVSAPAAPFALARAVLALTDVCAPGADTDAALAELDHLGLRLANLIVAEGVTPVAALRHVLVEEAGFRGANDEYYNPLNSSLSDVLRRRIGLPITLSVIYIEVGRLAGLRMHGIGFPAHFLVAVDGKSKGAAGDPREYTYLDPFNQGSEHTFDELAVLLTQRFGRRGLLFADLIKPVSRQDIVVRMLRNISEAFARREDFRQSLRALNRVLALEPDSASDLATRAEVLMRLQRLPAARLDALHCLRLNPSTQLEERATVLLTTIDTLWQGRN